MLFLQRMVAFVSCFLGFSFAFSAAHYNLTVKGDSLPTSSCANGSATFYKKIVVGPVLWHCKDSYP